MENNNDDDNNNNKSNMNNFDLINISASIKNFAYTNFNKFIDTSRTYVRQIK